MSFQYSLAGESWSMRKCARCSGSTCLRGRERDPPDTRGSAYRESNDAAIGGQPCGVTSLCPLYHAFSGLLRSSRSDFLELLIFLACSECSLPLQGFPHHRCEV